MAVKRTERPIGCDKMTNRTQTLDREVLMQYVKDMDLGLPLIVDVPLQLKSYNKTQGLHWSRNHKRKKAEVLSVWAALSTQPRKVPLPCHVVITRISPRPLDPDNFIAAAKTVVDTIADWLIPGLPPGKADSDPRITWQYLQRKGQPKEHAVCIEFHWIQNAERDMTIPKNEDSTWMPPPT